MLASAAASEIPPPPITIDSPFNLPAGVHDALKKMYLKRLVFGISADAEGSKLLEVSIWSPDVADNDSWIAPELGVGCVRLCQLEEHA